MGLFGPRHWGKGPKPEKPQDDIIFDDDYEEDEGERISVWDAADIWVSNGKDEDYMFGYTEEELEDAL